MNSKILNADHFEWLINEKFKSLFESVPKFNLIYRGSEDGFTARDFHRKCDNFSNTLIVVQSTQSNIFGGFVSEPWDSLSTGYKYDQTAFLFSLKNEYGEKLVLDCCSPEYAIYNDKNEMPMFGAGLDLALKDLSNEYNNSSSRLGYAYKVNIINILFFY
jgi:hypothetical protein